MFKHQNQSALNYTENQLQDDDIYHQRSAAETAFRVLKQRFGDRLDSRTWYRQFRELVLKCGVKNIEDQVKAEG